MTVNTSKHLIDSYLLSGCGRCKLYDTPKCKVNFWRTELQTLRAILLDCGLKEELKWSVPCYTHKSKNVLILAAFNGYCSLNFFKGALLNDPEGILSKAGEHSNAGRQLRFTSAEDVIKLQEYTVALVKQAMDIEAKGLKVESKAPAIAYPEELKQAFEDNAAFDRAFHALTPGRQRAYLLHFTSAAQSKTRMSRIEKHMPRIMQGIGFHD